MNKINITSICTIQVGNTPSRSNPAYWGEGFPWLSIADMNQGIHLKDTKETITTKALAECRCKLVPENTVLLSFKLSIGKVGITKIPLYTNEAIAAFIIKDPSKITTKYLYYALKNVDHTIGSNKAVMGRTLNKELLQKIEIPLPPIEMQKQIVKTLDTADTLRTKRKQALELMEKYIESTFLEMFGNPITNPRRWKTTEFSNICSKILGGGTPSKAIPEFYKGEIPWVTPKDMKLRYISDSQDHISDIAVEKSSAKMIPAESLLMVIRSGILKKKLPVAINTRSVAINQDMKAYVINSSVANPKFILFFFELAQGFLLNKVRAVTADNINSVDIKSCPVIIPPIELQNEFSEIVQKNELLKKSMQAQSSLLNEHLQILMKNHLN